MSMFSFQAIHNYPCFEHIDTTVVYRLCQCSLFKQFTTRQVAQFTVSGLFIDYVNVLFSSNSQLTSIDVSHIDVVYRLCQCSLFKQFTTAKDITTNDICCLSIMSMFSFQAIHNTTEGNWKDVSVVYRLCQCSLFEQFTTSSSRENVVSQGVLHHQGLPHRNGCLWW